MAEKRGPARDTATTRISRAYPVQRFLLAIQRPPHRTTMQRKKTMRCLQEVNNNLCKAARARGIQMSNAPEPEGDTSEMQVSCTSGRDIHYAHIPQGMSAEQTLLECCHITYYSSRNTGTSEMQTVQQEALTQRHCWRHLVRLTSTRAHTTNIATAMFCPYAGAKALLAAINSVQ